MANIITDNLIQSKPAMDSIERFCDRYVTSSVLSSCGIKKQADIEESKSLEYIVPDELSSAMPEKAEDDNQTPTLAKKICKCIAARKIFIDYMLCFLLNFTIHSLFKIGLYFEDYKRDTLYRFLTIAKTRWEALQPKVAGSVIRDIEADSTPNHKNVEGEPPKQLEGHQMTPDEKSRLTAMHKAGRSYTEIADELGISKNTIKTFCCRKGLAPEAEGMPEETTTVPATDRLCPQCGKPVIQPEGRKQKKFCSDTCRNRWWNSYMNMVKQKAI